jgi:hypothetical protein
MKLMLFLLLFGQSTDSLDFSAALRKQERVNMRGMSVLGTWAMVNIGFSAPHAFGPGATEHKYFNQMNFFWNTVNLGLAIPGYFSARKKFGNAKNDSEYFALQNKRNKKIFLINTLLDVVYCGSGWWMWDKGNRENNTQLIGFGKSVVLQGGFLFGFDLAMFVLHKKNGESYKLKAL